MKAPYLATIEDLAARRRELTAVIVALANIQGVDPAPYLDVPAFKTLDLTQPGGEPRAPQTKPPTEDRKAVPQPRPTEGAERRPAGNQVLDAKVLSVLKNGPLGPKTISDLVNASKYVLAPVFKRLVLSQAITKSGAGRGLTFQIP